MDAGMTKAEIMKLIQSEREAFEGALAQLNQEQMTQPGEEGSWSVKDILAHITYWERRTLEWIEESLRGEVPQRPAPGMTWDDLDRLNEQTCLLNKDRELPDVLADFHRSYERALGAVEILTEEQLAVPQRIAWWEGEPMWRLVADNTWEHYREHKETIDKLLEHS